jgi:putative methionine-R-sulfoxide reductase with GAF domain
VPITMNNTISQIRSTAASGGGRSERAARLAALIRKLGDYRWVGIYDVGAEIVSLIAWDGPGAPENPSFPVNQGLTGAAIAQKRAVVVGDVRNDPRYLAAFGSTLSEMIVPVLSPEGDRVMGTVDVESERAGAFSARDQQMIEQCAQAALPLWLLR